MTKKKATIRRGTSSSETLRTRVLGHFEHLRVPLREDHLDTILREAENESISHLDFLDRLIGEQADLRRERSIERRIRAARFDERKTLEDFEWAFNKAAIDRQQIEDLATADFVERKDNLLMVGQSGVGKSHILQAIGMRACAAGHSVRYTTSAAMIAELTAALADHTLPKCLRRYVRPALLILDEFGFDKVERLESPESASLIYKVIDARHRKGSIALGTNVDFERWGEYLGDAPLSMALLDRLVDGATILKLRGKSYRARRTKTPPKSRKP